MQNINLYHMTKFLIFMLFAVYYFYSKISSFTPVLSIRTVLNSFLLLIFYFEKFSIWIWHLLFAVYVILNLSNIKK